jgi:prepilin signal peptidase PulO-like enzyme (type II secretory pathway)
MAMTLRCRTCGAIIPGRYPVFLLTLALAFMTVIMMLIIPTLVGFATVAGGAALFVGVFVAMLALYLYLRVGNTCQACRASEK